MLIDWRANEVIVSEHKTTNLTAMGLSITIHSLETARVHSFEDENTTAVDNKNKSLILLT